MFLNDDELEKFLATNNPLLNNSLWTQAAQSPNVNSGGNSGKMPPPNTPVGGAGALQPGSGGGGSGRRYSGTDHARAVKAFRGQMELINKQTQKQIDSSALGFVGRMPTESVSYLTEFAKTNDFDAVFREALAVKASPSRGLGMDTTAFLPEKARISMNARMLTDLVSKSTLGANGSPWEKNKQAELLKFAKTGLKQGILAEQALDSFLGQMSQSFSTTNDTITAVNEAISSMNIGAYMNTYGVEAPKALKSPKIKQLAPGSMKALTDVELSERAGMSSAKLSVPAIREQISRALPGSGFSPGEASVVNRLGETNRSPTALRNLLRDIGDPMKGAGDILSEENQASLLHTEALDPGALGKRYRTQMEQVAKLFSYSTRFGLRRGMAQLGTEILPMAEKYPLVVGAAGGVAAGALAYEGMKAYGLSSLSNLSTAGVGGTGGFAPWMGSLLTGATPEEYLNTSRQLSLIQRPGTSGGPNMNSMVNNASLFGGATGLGTQAGGNMQIQYAQLGGKNWTTISRYLEAGAGTRFNAAHAQAAFQYFTSLGIAPSESQLVQTASTLASNPQVAAMMPAISSTMGDASKTFAIAALTGRDPNDLLANPGHMGAAYLDLFGKNGMFGFGGGNLAISSMIGQSFGLSPQQIRQQQMDPEAFKKGYEQLANPTNIIDSLRSAIDAQGAERGNLMHEGGVSGILAGAGGILIDALAGLGGPLTPRLGKTLPFATGYDIKTGQWVGGRSDSLANLQRARAAGSDFSSLTNASDKDITDLANQLEPAGSFNRDTSRMVQELQAIKNGITNQNPPGTVDYSANNRYTGTSGLPIPNSK